MHGSNFFDSYHLYHDHVCLDKTRCTHLVWRYNLARNVGLPWKYSKWSLQLVWYKFSCCIWLIICAKLFWTEKLKSRQSRLSWIYCWDSKYDKWWTSIGIIGVPLMYIKRSSLVLWKSWRIIVIYNWRRILQPVLSRWAK